MTRSLLVAACAVAVSLLGACNLFEQTARPQQPQAGAQCPVEGEVYNELTCKEGQWRADDEPSSEGAATAGGVYPGAAHMQSSSYELTGELAPSGTSHRATSQTYEVELQPIIATSH